MNLREQIKALKLEDDRSGLKQNAVIEEVLKIVDNYKCKLQKEETSREMFCYCSWCDFDFYELADDNQLKELNYCPNCGAKIIKE